MEPPRPNIHIFRILLAAALLVATYLATTSLQYPVVESMNDKVNHILAFYVLALLADFSFPRTGFGPGKALVLLGYGLSIEVIQYFLPYRSSSLYDLAADGAGLLVYGISLPALRYLPWLRSRWTFEAKDYG